MGQEPPAQATAAPAPDHDRADYGPHRLADRVGLYRRQVERARDLGLLPAPDVDGTRWSAALVDDIAARTEQIRAALDAEQAWGATRCAHRLAEATGLAVEPADVEALAQRGLLHQVDEYKGYPLYRLADVDALTEREDLAAVVAERQAWMAASLDMYAAAERLRWRYDSLVADAAAAGVSVRSRPLPIWTCAGSTSSTRWPPAGSPPPATARCRSAGAATSRSRCTGRATSRRC
jgi:hypothetical protein